jgi:hypothetical protein
MILARRRYNRRTRQRAAPELFENGVRQLQRVRTSAEHNITTSSRSRPADEVQGTFTFHVLRIFLLAFMSDSSDTEDESDATMFARRGAQMFDGFPSVQEPAEHDELGFELVLHLIGSYFQTCENLYGSRNIAKQTTAP